MKLLTTIITMKVLVSIIVWVVMFFMLADTTFKLKPFNLECKSLGYAIGVYFILAGISIVYYSGQSKGRQITTELVEKELVEFEIQKNKPF